MSIVIEKDRDALAAAQDSNIIWQPQSKQALFMSRPEFEAFYGGAAGGGKTDCAVMEALRQVDHPKYRGLIVRKTYPQLSEIIDRSIELYPRIFPGAKFNDSKHFWKFPSGAKVIFKSFPYLRKKDDFQGLPFQFIDVDELTHFLLEEYMYLMSRCRPRAAGQRSYVRAQGNPGGVGHGWVKGRFVTAGEPYKRIWESVDVGGKLLLRDRVFIPATVFDNKILLQNDPNYIATLAMLPEAEKKALLYGDWDSFQGQVFMEWKHDSSHYKDRLWTHVIDPFKVPAEWRVWRCFDFGYSKPFSVGWYAVDYDGRLYRIRELYGCTGTPNQGVKWEPTRIAQEIKRIEADDPNLKGRKIMGIADPSIWDKSRGESVADMMERMGVHWSPADNTRIPGKMQIHYRLAFDEGGLPMLYIFNSNKHFLRTFPNLVYSQKDVEDVDTNQEDHCLIGETYVDTENGRAQIKDLVNTSGYVYSHDGEIHLYTDCRLTQSNVDVYTVELDDGRKITATKNHRFMLEDGTWKRLDELAEGDNLKEIPLYDIIRYKR